MAPGVRSERARYMRGQTAPPSRSLTRITGATRSCWHGPSRTIHAIPEGRRRRTSRGLPRTAVGRGREVYETEKGATCHAARTTAVWIQLNVHRREGYRPARARCTLNRPRWQGHHRAQSAAQAELAPPGPLQRPRLNRASPNRPAVQSTGLEGRASAAARPARDDAGRPSLFPSTLDRFPKLINDSHGPRGSGDQVLREDGRAELRGILRPVRTTLSRPFGGDEFHDPVRGTSRAREGPRSQVAEAHRPRPLVGARSPALARARRSFSSGVDRDRGRAANGAIVRGGALLRGRPTQAMYSAKERGGVRANAIYDGGPCRLAAGGRAAGDRDRPCVRAIERGEPAACTNQPEGRPWRRGACRRRRGAGCAGAHPEARPSSRPGLKFHPRGPRTPG